MALAQPQLGGVLDRHDPLLPRDRAGQRVQRRRLAGARAAAHQHRRPRRHAQREQLGHLRRQRAARHQLPQREALAPEAPHGQARPRQRQRRDHHVHARAVREPRVAERRRLVHPAPERREDALDRVHQLGLGAEATRRCAPAARGAPRTPPPARSPSPRRPRDRTAAARADRARWRAAARAGRAPPARRPAARRPRAPRARAPPRRARPCRSRPSAPARSAAPRSATQGRPAPPSGWRRREKRKTLPHGPHASEPRQPHRDAHVRPGPLRALPGRADDDRPRHLRAGLEMVGARGRAQRARARAWSSTSGSWSAAAPP